MCKLLNSNIALTYKHLDLVHPDEQPNHHGRNDPRDERGVDEGEGELQPEQVGGALAAGEGAGGSAVPHVAAVIKTESTSLVKAKLLMQGVLGKEIS